MITDSTEPMQLEADAVISTFENYGAAWGLYIGLTLLLAGLVWFTFRKQHFLLKWLLSSVVLAGALCFGHPAENVDTYSPLILNTMVELFDGNKEQFISDMKFIALVWGILFITGVAIWLLIRFLRKDKPDTKNPQNKAEKKAKEKKEKPTKTKNKPRGETPVEPTIGDDL
jgi:cytochrome bd-type quinol oxidase subunit 1